MWRFFIFCGSIAFAGKPAGSSCVVEMSPPSVVVRFGDPLSVNCSSSSNQTEGMGWESTHGGTALTKGVSLLSFELSSVNDWKVNPGCFINLFDGTQCFKDLPVTIYKTPDSVTMPLPVPLGQVVEGQKYNVQCEIVNVAPLRNLSVHWYRGNNVVYTESFNDTTLTPVNKSIIRTMIAHRDDNGTQIWCEAALNFEPVGRNPPAMRSTAHEVIVLYPPVLATPENETLELPANSKFILNCTAKGNPMPAYSWQFPHPTPQTNKDQNENEPILIPSFQLPGPYACTASNRLGKRTKYFMVIETKRDRTTFAALVGGFVVLGVVIATVGLLLLTPDGTFSCSKGSYLRGRPV